MRVFVFSIGGTGSRVLTSLIMQLAAGVRPIDKNGKMIKDLSIVPIVVDPHEDNAGLQQATELLDNYRSIHNSIYGTQELNAEGFFSVKIETLKEINSANVSADRFFFKMQRVSDNKFDKFIGLDDMSSENRLFAQLLFSKEELETRMHEGFYGSPNIGCVALNEFKKSKDFDAFRSAYSEGDKLFFIGSIFGGTGAAGLPLFITSIRDLEHADNEDTGKTLCSKAPIGALVVMPYFSIAKDDESVINDTEFTIKTRSALRYYETNLNDYINTLYYIADPLGTQDFENDPGNRDNQKGNKAHIVEFAGALSLFDFIESENIEIYEDRVGRNVAVHTDYKAYGLNDDKAFISFVQLAKSTNMLCMEPMMKFYLLRHFMGNHLLHLLDKPFAKKFEPKIERSIISRELDKFFKEYDHWCKEMESHGNTAHNLSLFMPVNENYTGAFKEIVTRKGFIGTKSVKMNDIQKCLDNVAQKPEHNNLPSAELRWFTIADRALQQIINENYEYSTLK